MNESTQDSAKLSEIAKILGARGGKIGGAVKNKNRTRESYQEAGRKGMLNRWTKVREQKARIDALLQGDKEVGDNEKR